ncbi:BNR-4 repeat-containing protein [Planctomycetota bacterium]
MRRTGILVLGTILLARAAVAGDKAPFQIPPAGTQQELQSGMDCPPASMLAFDSKNRPYLVNTRDPKRYGCVMILRKGTWVKRSFMPALKRAGYDLTPNYENPRDLGTMTFDSDDGMYIIVPSPRKRGTGESGEVEIDGDAVLLYSRDYGEAFKAYRLGARPYLCTLETANGGGTLDHPPALIVGKALKYVRDVTVTVRGRKEKLRFCEFDRLSVIFPRTSGDGLTLPAPIVVTEKANGVTSHSGALNVACGGDGRLYVAYIEVPDNLESGRNPLWVAEIDRKNGTVLKKTHLLDVHPDESDCHSTPSMVIDSKGALHVVAGSHAWKPDMQGFFYLHSVGKGIDNWTKPVSLGTMQTYVGLAIDTQDNLHLAYRHTPDLGYRRRDAKSGEWSEQAVIVRPPRRDTYTCYYHHVFVDRKGTVYLEFTFSDQKKKDYPHLLAVSADHGRHWGLASTGMFEKNILAATSPPR